MIERQTIWTIYLPGEAMNQKTSRKLSLLFFCAVIALATVPLALALILYIKILRYLITGKD